MTSKKGLSTRVQEILPSGIRKIFDLACQNPDGIDLSIGDPDFDIPDPVKNAGIHWIRKGFNHYVSTRGIPGLRDRLALYLSNRKVQFEDILITSGATGAYYLAMLALVTPGDEILIPDPYFVAYANVVLMCGGVPKFFSTYPDFKLKADSILPLISPKTKAIVINSPGNPTGVIYDKQELMLLADIAKRYGLYVISDEVYDTFTYGEKPFVSMGNVTDDAIIISGFSKRAAMTGWRLGYVSGPKSVIDAMATFQQYSYVCANSFAQKAAITALDYDIQPQVTKYAHRRNLLFAGLKDNFKLIKPEGAFYFFPEAPGGDAAHFVNTAIEHNIFVIPGSVFSRQNTHFRISFAVTEEKLLKAIDILNGIVVKYY